MKRKIGGEVFLLVVMMIGWPKSSISSASVSNEAPCEGDDIGPSYCFRCHADTIKLVDVIADLWRYKDLLIEPDDYERSNHAKLNCLDCHAFTWPFFPHQENVRSQTLTCTECHKGEKRFEKFGFEAIESEFRASVHEKNLPNSFSCFSCHNPHEFDVFDLEDEIKYTVEHSNRMCQKCHLSRTRFADLTTRPLPELEVSHKWLPKPELHWEHVRCVECHTPLKDKVSHRILAAKDAVRLCESCHTKNSILLNKLYRYRNNEQRDKFGFANSVIFNDAYIIGATRNIYLDWIFLGMVIGLILGLGGHGSLRIISAKVRKNGK